VLNITIDKRSPFIHHPQKWEGFSYDTKRTDLSRSTSTLASHSPPPHLYAFNVQNPMPAFPLPLRSGDTEPIINLQELFNQIYDIASYDLKIDYRNWEVIPALSEADTIWADGLLRDRDCEIDLASSHF
jgi:Protein of unknown function (DUF4058)